MMKKRLLILLLTIFSFSYTSIVFGSSNDTTDCEDCETLDSKGSLPTGAVSMSRLVYSAVLKVGSFSARYEIME